MSGSSTALSFIGAMFWMSVLTVMLIWVPVPMLGPLVAGLVGGWWARNLGTAILAVFVLCASMALLVGIGAGHFSGYPVIGAVTGLLGFALFVTHVGGLLAGAVVGALVASRYGRR